MTNTVFPQIWLIHSSTGRHLGSVHTSAIVNSAVSMCIQNQLFETLPSVLKHSLRSGIADYIILVLTCRDLFFTVAVPLDISFSRAHRLLQPCHLSFCLLGVFVLSCFDRIHPPRCEELSHSFVFP